MFLSNIATITTKKIISDFYIVLVGSKSAGMPTKNYVDGYACIKVTYPEIINPDFLYYALINYYNLGGFNQFIKGSVIPFITIEDLKKIKIG